VNVLALPNPVRTVAVAVETNQIIIITIHKAAEMTPAVMMAWTESNCTWVIWIMPPTKPNYGMNSVHSGP
jgi:hypothetical protein